MVQESREWQVFIICHGALNKMQTVSAALQLKALILHGAQHHTPCHSFHPIWKSLQDQTTGVTLIAHGNWFSSNGTQFQLLIISESSRPSAHSDLALAQEFFCSGRRKESDIFIDVESHIAQKAVEHLKPVRPPTQGKRPFLKGIYGFNLLQFSWHPITPTTLTEKLQLWVLCEGVLT